MLQYVCAAEFVKERHHSVSQCVAVCCSVLQCVAVCCSVLQCVAASCSLCEHIIPACTLQPDLDGNFKSQSLHCLLAISPNKKHSRQI